MYLVKNKQFTIYMDMPVRHLNNRLRDKSNLTKIAKIFYFYFAKIKRRLLK
jgi:hypothetical protein